MTNTPQADHTFSEIFSVLFPSPLRFSPAYSTRRVPSCLRLLHPLLYMQRRTTFQTCSAFTLSHLSGFKHSPTSGGRAGLREVAASTCCRYDLHENAGRSKAITPLCAATTGFEARQEEQQVDEIEIENPRYFHAHHTCFQVRNVQERCLGRGRSRGVPSDRGWRAIQKQ